MKRAAALSSAVVAVALLASCGGCSDFVGPSAAPVPDVPYELLAGAPERVELVGQAYVLEAYLNRDFMPVCPPDGQPLSAMVTMSEVHSLDVPDEIELGYVWVLHEGEVWAAALVGREPEGWESHTRVGLAGEGPKWGPFIHVDVVVGVLVGDDGMFLLAARDQWIHKTS